MSLFKDEQAHPLVLLRKYLSMFGVEALEWEPEVVKLAVQDETGTSIARVNLMKLLAAITVANHDRFWSDWQTFHFICQALNNLIPSAGSMHDHSIGQMMVAVDIANEIRKDLGPASRVPEFGERVARYIAAQAQESGIWYLPAPLDFANRYAAGFMQECTRCGNEEEIQLDGLCSYCTDRYNVDSLQKMEPNPVLAKKFDASKVRPFILYPYHKVQSRLAEARKKKDVVLGETPEDVCAARILTGLEYMEHRRAQLRQQSEAA